MSWGSIAIVVAVLAALYLWYAAIVARRNKVREALSSIDVHLTQRHDLIPNIVQLAARYMAHERGLIEEVTRLRSRLERPLEDSAAAMGERFRAEGELARKTARLLVAMEAYPELKADATVIEAQRTWTEVEAQITAARRFYNAAVNRLNSLIQIFPGSLLAALAGVEAMPFFEADTAARKAPSVEEILGAARPEPEP
ncbi:LemA family protein [Benzoatithermus flavus]|uniref:LemA family protein n=1 Tax=Benzoatithermus flavus TaxID=3108223 RepID=A0ABU8XUX5_9PROT